MSNDELATALRPMLSRIPFRPFLIEFMSGSSILVSHPETVVRRGVVFLYRASDSAYRIFNGASVCQLIEVMPTPPS